MFANFLPNMSSLSLDRWSFFHTKLGTVYFDCRPVRGNKEYVCVLSRLNKCSVRNFRLLCHSEVLTDQELALEYLNMYNFDFNFKLLYTNDLAFPNVTDDMREEIKRYITESKFKELVDFIKLNKCFKNSIVPKDFKFQHDYLDFEMSSDECDD